MDKYQVKTRNFHCKRPIKALLDISKCAGVTRVDTYEDGDAKYFLETSSPVKAWTCWFYFMLLRHWSGGWTYIVRPGHELQYYKAIN